MTLDVESLARAGTLRQFLDDFSVAKPWLTQCGFRDLPDAHRRLRRIALSGVPLDLFESLTRDLAQILPGSADPDMALNNFERFLERVRSPLSMLTFLERKPHTLAVLIQIFSTSQYFSDVIVDNPEYFDFLWESGSAALDPELLRDEVLAEIRAVQYQMDDVLHAVRRHRNRELVRIGFRDIVLGEPLDRVTQSTSDLADALTQVALAVAYHRQEAKYGEPRSNDDKYVRVVFLALGKLGGQELNYSSDIDFLVVYEADGMTNGKGPRQESISNADFFSAVVRDVVHVLSANTPGGIAYRVDLRLRPHGGRAPLCMSLAETLAYYERHGRTWERQMLVKARLVAGSRRLGETFLRSIEPFVYRKYLSFVEINEIKTIKRRIERKAEEQSRDSINIKVGRGGIRDIEFVVQFLQLLHGRVRPELRQVNTLRALRALVASGCINPDEHAALETAYRFLRKAEHRLQFMFDLQKHTLPESAVELDKLALRLGYLSSSSVRPGQEFLADLHQVMARNQTILKHLMTDLFADAKPSQDVSGSPESDLILDPDPPADRIEEVLGRFPFANKREAYKNLMLLADEEIPFFSSIRCRHFLAGIAPELLTAVAETPDPDMALVNLEKVTASLGAKGVLWESLSQSPPLLRLFVQLCAWSQFLSEILINNPGMIDELLDTLVMNRPPTREELAADIAFLLKGAMDIEPILHGFKNTTLLSIGVNDILGKRGLRETMASLSDLAEVVLGAIVDAHRRSLVEQYGEPTIPNDSDRPCRFAIVGLGKLGGRELSYHGDLDILLLYEGDGDVVPRNQGGRSPQPFSNVQFFTELIQRTVKTAGQMTASGRLYSVDLRLRPTGRSGALVSPLERFDAYYSRAAAVWERQAIARGRVVYGDPDFAVRVQASLNQAVIGGDAVSEVADEVLRIRQRLEESRPAGDIKRGPGGMADVEFAVQLAQIRHGRKAPSLLEPNIFDAIDRIQELAVWPPDRCRIMSEGYGLLRAVESRLRIVYNIARSDLPGDPRELDKLASRTGHESGEQLREELVRRMLAIRTAFLDCVREASA